MSHGLMQLCAYGEQDVYLTSNSQITFFKTQYAHNTNFKIEVYNQVETEIEFEIEDDFILVIEI